MRIILIEFAWQAQAIINKKESFKRDVIVSLNPESSYILKTNEVSYFETYQICNHKELWSQYKDITDHTIKISKVLDEALWDRDKRFRDLNWKFFDDHHFLLKISFDQLFYYAELISKLIEKFNPTEIIIADTGNILIEDNCLIDPRISVIKYLLKTFNGSFNKIKISFVFQDQNQNQNKKSKFLFFLNFKNLIKNRLKNIYYKINFLVNYHLSKPKYLSVNCDDILRYKKLYPNESKLFLLYYQRNINKKNINDSTFFDNFIDCLKNKTNFYDLIKYKNISFELIFHEILLKLLQGRNFVLDEFYKAKKIVKQTKPSCVIFQSTAPFGSPTNITFRKVCIDLKIPFVIWTHGGYGATYSLPGYDVTDFRFCTNHISYGPFLKDSIADNKCILKKLGLTENYNILPVGSPKLDYEIMKKNLNKILKPNNKKTILFLTGALVPRNNFWFGRDREKFETSLWEFHYDILNLLKKYQNKYNIIFKDYPKGHQEGHQRLWKKILIDINADKILYVSSEHSVSSLLKISDLNIMPWISTTFFEALYFEADIFVLEEDIIEKPFKEQLKDEIYYFKNNKNFLLELEKYLDNGNFYICKKTNSKNYFLKLDSLKKRDELLNNALSKIN